MSEARIKLAEAMGWTWDESIRKRGDFPDRWCCWIKPDGDKWFAADAMPDPFTDANDDYAVLEWMQDYQGNQDKIMRWHDFCLALQAICDPPLMTEYEVGYYARAAVSVLERQKT